MFTPNKPKAPLFGTTVVSVALSFASVHAQGPASLLKLPLPPADQTLNYGADPLQIAELRLPKSKGPLPVVIVVHGGCWADHFPGPYPLPDASLLKPLAAALTNGGVATWNIEYRRAGSPGGGGWPITYLDLATAVDYLRKIAPTYNLDLANVTVIGHSSGGQLALWLGIRSKLPKTSELYTPNPLALKDIIDIDGPPDLAAAQPLESQYCPIPAVTQFLGGTPTEQPIRYRDGSAQPYLPLGVPQIIVTAGLLQNIGTMATDYRTAATAKGDIITLVPIGGSHFDMLDPTSAPGKAVIATILAAAGPKK
jgi:acetyl esterase/lipase